MDGGRHSCSYDRANAGHPLPPAWRSRRLPLLLERVVPATEDPHPARPVAYGTAATMAELALHVLFRIWLGKGKNDRRNRTLVVWVKKLGRNAPG